MDEQIAHLLVGTLSPDAAIRGQAERGLGEAQRHGETGLSLARICCLAHDTTDISLRQSAGVNLKKYTRERWSIAFPTFIGDPPSLEIKAQIRELVFSGLSDRNRKIRLACAAVVSEIASADWPEEWPQLLDSLVQLLASGNADSVHGAMRVMADFVSSDLSEDQLLPLANTILPQLLHILMQQSDVNAHSAVTRSQAVSIFNQCLSTLYMVKETHPHAATYATTQVLPQWVDAFKHILSQDLSVSHDWSSLHVRNEIFVTLSTIIVSFPKSLTEHADALLVCAVQHLSALAEPFRATAINDDLESDFDLTSDDGASLTLQQVASHIFLFVSGISRRPAGRGAILDKGQSSKGDAVPTELFLQIAHQAIFYAQIPQEDEERWASDVNAFVADEDDEIPAATLRTAALDLISGLANAFLAPSVCALTVAVERASQQADELRRHGAQDWWRGHESCLTHLSSLSEELEEHNDAARQAGRPPAFDLEAAFGKLVMPFLGRSDLPFLQGRALIFASRFATALPQHLQQQFFESSFQAFESAEASLVVKISALRALKNFCQQIPDSPTFAALGGRITTNLLPLLGQATEATLILILETLQRTLSLPNALEDEQTSNQIVDALLQPILRGVTVDPILSSTLSDLFRTLSSSSSPVMEQSLRQVALPRLAELMDQAENDESRPLIDAGVVALNAILDGRSTPLGSGFFAPVASAVFGVLSRTEDDSVLQEGLECLTFVVRKDVDQLIQWRGQDGTDGLTALFGVVGRVLDPSRSESGGLFVGDLLLHVFRRAGTQILPILPQLLQALVVRLSTAITATFSQSLLLPFAYLIHAQPDTVLELLESVDAPDGRKGVEVVLGTWADLADIIQGFWNNRVSTVALGRLLLNRRPCLDQVQVKGDLIPRAGGGILTRSRSQKNPDQFSQISFRTKALKILLKELEAAAEETAPDEAAIEDDGEGTQDGDDWEDDEAVEAVKGAIDISKFIGGDGDFFDDDEDDADDDDPDLKSDPLYTMSLPTYIGDTLREFANTDRAAFDACAQHLNPVEMHTLHSI